MAFIVEDGTGRSDATSLASVEFADAYFAGNPFANAWGAADTARKQWALMAASTDLMTLNLEGWPVSVNQALMVPRYGLVSAQGGLIASTSVPPIFAAACCEQALARIVSDRVQAQDQGRVSSLTMGATSVTYANSGSSSVAPITEAARRMLARFELPLMAMRA